MDNFLHAFWISGTNKEPQATVSPKALHLLFYFLFQMIEQITVKKLPEAYVQTIADFLQGDNTRVLTLFTKDAVDRRRGYARKIRQCINSEIPLIAKIKNACCHSLLCIQIESPFLSRYIVIKSVPKFSLNRVGYIANTEDL